MTCQCTASFYILAHVICSFVFRVFPNALPIPIIDGSFNKQRKPSSMYDDLVVGVVAPDVGEVVLHDVVLVAVGDATVVVVSLAKLWLDQ